MIHDLDVWNSLKKKLNLRQKTPSFKEREIWWCSIGLNVGDEENGKSELFSRPVLVLKKFNNNIFLGIPLTSKIKSNKYYLQITFKEKLSCLLLSQIRTFESKRLTTMEGKLSQTQFEMTLREVVKVISENYSAS